MTDADIRVTLSRLEEKQTSVERAADRLVTGRKVKIVGDWNGQPYGSSRPSRKGQVFTAAGISLNGQWSSIQIKEYPYDAPPYLNQVEFID